MPIKRSKRGYSLIFVLSLGAVTMMSILALTGIILPLYRDMGAQTMQYEARSQAENGIQYALALINSAPSLGAIESPIVVPIGYTGRFTVSVKMTSLAVSTYPDMLTSYHLTSPNADYRMLQSTAQLGALKRSISVIIGPSGPALIEPLNSSGTGVSTTPTKDNVYFPYAIQSTGSQVNSGIPSLIINQGVSIVAAGSPGTANVVSNGSVMLYGNATVDGSIQANGSVGLAGGNSVGAIQSNGTISISGANIVNGNVSAQDAITIDETTNPGSTTTINGNLLSNVPNSSSIGIQALASAQSNSAGTAPPVIVNGNVITNGTISSDTFVSDSAGSTNPNVLGSDAKVGNPVIGQVSSGTDPEITALTSTQASPAPQPLSTQTATVSAIDANNSSYSPGPISANSSGPVGPSDIGNISLSSNQTLTLAPGDYTVGSISAAPGSQIVVNSNSTQGVRLFVDDSAVSSSITYANAQYSGAINFAGIVTQSGPSSNFQIFYNGSSNVNVLIDPKNTNSFNGLIYAPNANVALNTGTSGSVSGALVGNTVSLSGTGSIRYDNSLANVANASAPGYNSLNPGNPSTAPGIQAATSFRVLSWQE